jgi:hypothetical protein
MLPCTVHKSGNLRADSGRVGTAIAVCTMCAIAQLRDRCRSRNLRGHHKASLRMPLNPVDAAVHEAHTATVHTQSVSERAEIWFAFVRAGKAHVEQDPRFARRHLM